MVSDYSGLHNNDEFFQYLVERYVLLIEQHTNRRKGLSFDKDSIAVHRSLVATQHCPTSSGFIKNSRPLFIHISKCVPSGSVGVLAARFSTL